MYTCKYLCPINGAGHLSCASLTGFNPRQLKVLRRLRSTPHVLVYMEFSSFSEAISEIKLAIMWFQFCSTVINSWDFLACLLSFFHLTHEGQWTKFALVFEICLSASEGLNQTCLSLFLFLLYCYVCTLIYFFIFTMGMPNYHYW